VIGQILRYWWVLCIFCLVAFGAELAGMSATAVFALAALGTIPTAAVLGRATEEIAISITEREIRAERPNGPSGLGVRVGGLLNATFGNIPELFVGILALHQGYVTLTKATIIGSVIGNSAFVMGTAFLVGGMRNGTQRFDSRDAGHYATLMLIAIATLGLPSLLNGTKLVSVPALSVVAAVLLFVVYASFLIFTLGRIGTSSEADTGAVVSQIEDVAAGSWSLRRSVATMAVTTALVFLSSDALVSSVHAFSNTLGWRPVFVGIIVVPIVSNVAEQSSAILLAWRRRADLAISIVSGSSLQVALFVTPLLVLASIFTHPLTLVFSALEIGSLILVSAMFFLVAQDGESNWFEGLQLLLLYVLTGTVFFFVPGSLS
jgi:Ca2+:H+ antiporter